MSDFLIDPGPPPAAASAHSDGYTVLARRYRSTDFDEVVGQEHVSQTLKNAIERGRLAHAYLFTGTRGVGKTSMARILAKALNATPNLRQREEVAQAIMRGGDIDVIEIDAASNTGVENVRELIQNASLTPARSPYKIYIIDEVHMLSRNAFNALLKIMEEPPSHVKFILCTTEVQKVPATIQSRCQRFDFRNIPAAKIAAHLRDVLAREKVSASDEAIHEVARLAGGSMRDALSLLDRLIAAGDGAVTIETVERTVGAPDHAQVARVVDGIVAGDSRNALEAAGELLGRGVSLEQAMDVLVDHLRNVLVISACGADSNLVELFGEAKEAAVRHAASLDAPAAVHMIALCEAAARNIKQSSTGRSLFDAVIVRLALTEQLASIPAILSGSASAARANAGPSAAIEKKKPVTDDSMRGGPRIHESRSANPRSVQVEPPALDREVKPALPQSAAPALSPPRRGPSATELAAAKADPIVARAVEILGATIVDVRQDAEQLRESQSHQPLAGDQSGRPEEEPR